MNGSVVEDDEEQKRKQIYIYLKNESALTEILKRIQISKRLIKSMTNIPESKLNLYLSRNYLQLINYSTKVSHLLCERLSLNHSTKPQGNSCMEG